MRGEASARAAKLRATKAANFMVASGSDIENLALGSDYSGNGLCITDRETRRYATRPRRRALLYQCHSAAFSSPPSAHFAAPKNKGREKSGLKQGGLGNAPPLLRRQKRCRTLFARPAGEAGTRGRVPGCRLPALASRAADAPSLVGAVRGSAPVSPGMLPLASIEIGSFENQGVSRFSRLAAIWGQSSPAAPNGCEAAHGLAVLLAPRRWDEYRSWRSICLNSGLACRDAPDEVTCPHRVREATAAVQK